MNSWQINPILDRYLGSGSYALVSVLLLLLLAGWVVAVWYTPATPRRRCALAVLRLLTVMTLVVAMLRPQRVYVERQQQSATLAVLIDGSRSMAIEDTPQGSSRWSNLVSMLTKAAPHWERLAHDLEIKPYVFGSDVRSVALTDGRPVLDETSPVADESAYGRAIAEVLQREDGRRLIGLILAGDGATQTTEVTDETPEASVRRLAAAGCPLYTVPFGRSAGKGQARDVAVETMPDDLSVFAKNRLVVTGSLRISGYVNRDIPVQLVVEKAPGKEEVVDTEIYRAIQDGEELQYALDYIPEEPGEYKLLVRAADQEGEVTTTNNQLPTYLTVLAGGLRVLYLQGELRNEQRFLRRALAASPDLDVTLLTLHTRDRRHWPSGKLTGMFQAGAYDVYILGDLDASAFADDDLARLAETIRGGAGLLTLGGWHSYRPGGYHRTALASLLPVELDPQIDRFVRQNFGEPIRSAWHLEGPLQMLPATLLSQPYEYLMHLSGSTDVAAAWRNLPPLDGANRFRGVKEGAEVVAEDQAGQPLLVAGQPGGRVLSFAGDSTWRWVMHGQGDAHRRFWRQAILWLAGQDRQASGQVWVKLKGRRFTGGQRVAFDAGAQSPAGDPLPDAQLQAVVTGPDGFHSTARLLRQGDHYLGNLPAPPTAGTYAVDVRASRDGTVLGNDTSNFMVYEKDRELSGATADAALLGEIAAMTGEHGGRLVAPEGFNGLLDQLAKQPLELSEEIRVTEDYWDRWYVFVALVGLLSTEWFLRKRWRLV